MNETTLNSKAREWWLMSALMIGVFLSPLNVTFTSVALPTMRDHFRVTVEQVTWIGAAYFIPSVVVMPLQSAVGEKWGVRRMYASGLFLLAAGAFLGVLAPNFQWLLASRIVQGIGWSALYPLALILIRKHFPPTRQGEMMGIWESAVGAATIVSPVIGGMLVDFSGWQSLFYILGGVSALGGILGLLVIPSESQSDDASRTSIEWVGALLFTLALTATLFGITRKNIPVLLLSGVVWSLWVWWARRVDSPFLQPGFFTNVRFVSASFAANLRMLIAIAVLTALPLFFEDVQGLRPSQVGGLMVIYSVFLFLSAWPGGRWADSVGARTPSAVGYVAMILGVLLLFGFDERLSVPLVAVALGVRGIGAGLSQTPFAKAATDVVPPEFSKMAAGLYGTIRYSGLALGTALVGILLQNRLEHYGAIQGGPAAIPAYRELWLILVLLGILGLGLTWMIGKTS